MYRFMLLAFVVGCGPKGFDLEVRAAIANTSGYDFVDTEACITDGVGVSDCALTGPIPTGEARVSVGSSFAFIGDVYTIVVGAVDVDADGYIWGPEDFIVDGPVLEVPIEIDLSHCCHTL